MACERAAAAGDATSPRWDDALRHALWSTARGSSWTRTRALSSFGGAMRRLRAPETPERPIRLRLRVSSAEAGRDAARGSEAAPVATQEGRRSGRRGRAAPPAEGTVGRRAAPAPLRAARCGRRRLCAHARLGTARGREDRATHVLAARARAGRAARV